MEFGVRAGLLRGGCETKLRREADELVRIFVKSRTTARENLRQSKQLIGLLLIGLLFQYALLRILS
jgi:hypothetical protein